MNWAITSGGFDAEMLIRLLCEALFIHTLFGAYVLLVWAANHLARILGYRNKTTKKLNAISHYHLIIMYILVCLFATYEFLKIAYASL